MKIVLASNNSGKVREFNELLKPFHFEVVPQAELGVEDIEETGLTFIENALLKARHACRVTGLPALSDDSGLAVEVLNGAPGIYSARYAGIPTNAANNIKKLLHAMENIPDEKRQASFHCVLAFMRHAEDPTPLICHAKWNGMILKSPRGEQGFGYDPVFFVPSENMTAAEMPSELKHRLSHRGQALQVLIKQLSSK